MKAYKNTTLLYGTMVEKNENDKQTIYPASAVYTADAGCLPSFASFLQIKKILGSKPFEKKIVSAL